MIANSRSDAQLEKEAAKAVSKTTKNSPSATPNAEWSESKVAALKAYEYEKHEEEILNAMKSGNFVYDMSGAVG